MPIEHKKFYLKCKVYLTHCASSGILKKEEAGMGRGEDLKNRVTELREAEGLTQKELGEKVGVSRQAVNAIETGKFDPSVWLAHDLADYFGLFIEELFDFEGSARK